jgi:hypothetical protein
MATSSVKRKPAPPRKPVTTGTPHVIVDFIFDDGALFITIENIGAAPALKVKTRFNVPINGVEGSVSINEMALFGNIEFLAPHKSIRTFLDTSAAYFRRDEPRKIAARITYCDTANRKYQNSVHHDLNIYADIGYIRRARDESGLNAD